MLLHPIQGVSNNRNIQPLILPTKRPPFEPPLIVSFFGDVYPSWARYLAADWKSSKQFCLLAKIPPKNREKPINSFRTHADFGSQHNARRYKKHVLG